MSGVYEILFSIMNDCQCLREVLACPIVNCKRVKRSEVLANLLDDLQIEVKLISLGKLVIQIFDRLILLQYAKKISFCLRHLRSAVRTAAKIKLGLSYPPYVHQIYIHYTRV